MSVRVAAFALGLTGLLLVIALGCSDTVPPPEPLPDIIDDSAKDDQPDRQEDGDDGPEEYVNPNCNPENCAGCCMGDLCVDGTDDDGCGSGGIVCETCGDNQICWPESQTCQLDPAVNFALIAKSGIVSETTLAGGSWDSDGNRPDPYVKVTSEGWIYEYRSWDDSNTLTPLWEYAILFNLPSEFLLAPLTVSVWDSDGNADDFMGECDLQLTQQQVLSGEDIVLECEKDQVEDDSGWTVTFYAVPMSDYYN